ncbi:MAG: hypothetical protein NT062_30025 [Proteobacteria bacterium]|nr:hypothetical protein [Pseudomonadota bacterium]
MTTHRNANPPDATHDSKRPERDAPITPRRGARLGAALLERDGNNATIGDEDRAIDTHQLGEMLGMAPISICQERARGGGPPFFRCGRNGRTIRYRLGAVREWIAARTIGGAR